MHTLNSGRYHLQENLSNGTTLGTDHTRNAANTGQSKVIVYCKFLREIADLMYASNLKLTIFKSPNLYKNCQFSTIGRLFLFSSDHVL